GIATQIGSPAEAAERGLKRFEPQELERAVDNLCRFFGALLGDVARLAAALGACGVRDLVGRTDLLVQTRALERVDLSDLLAPRERRTRELVPARASAAVATLEERALTSADRFVATAGAGALARGVISTQAAPGVRAAFRAGSVAGNGFAAYATDGVTLEVAGGAQDGAAKTALGGTFAVLKAPNAAGAFVDGSVGKAFAYGAQRGRFFVQGGADARACIRLSGADVVFGGELRGFAFEYMTGGRAVVLGDPGRWICSGMSGGRVFLRLDPARGLDDAALRARVAKGAKVSLGIPDQEEAAGAAELLTAYAALLGSSGQDAEAARARELGADVRALFRVVRPGGEVVDQAVTTE
ncbi:MAG TPA: hypothetical protein VNA89_14460, partial [Gemmatimonadaceae bacterium]|nr:hypothetical protein [Gemmatimonadaceae bacterium]